MQASLAPVTMEPVTTFLLIIAIALLLGIVVSAVLNGKIER